MNKKQLTLVFVGRFLISLFFIFSAVYKVIDWAESERALTAVLGDWQVYVSAASFWQQFFSFLMNWTWLILAIIVFLEFMAGICIFIGYRVKMAATVLVLFLALITVLLHHFWFLSGDKKEVQMMFFFKNMAVIGALLLLMAMDTKKTVAVSPFGGGRSSMSNTDDDY